ncbi:hypothetical protein GCM10027341_06260 [Spirosoma knui]
MTRAFWKFYTDLTKFNLGLSLLVTFVKSPVEGILLFVTGGMLLSLIAYEYFHSHEYYLYHNLGLTRMRLIRKAWLLNLGISAIVGALLFL